MEKRKCKCFWYDNKNTWIKNLTKHMSCKFHERKYNSIQKWNNDKRWCECKNPGKHYAYKKDYIWNTSTCTCKNGKYLQSFIGDTVITSDEITDVARSEPTKNVNKY